MARATHARDETLPETLCDVKFFAKMGVATFHWVSLPGVTPPSRRGTREGVSPSTAGGRMPPISSATRLRYDRQFLPHLPGNLQESRPSCYPVTNCISTSPRLKVFSMPRKHTRPNLPLTTDKKYVIIFPKIRANRKPKLALERRWNRTPIPVCLLVEKVLETTGISAPFRV